MQFSRNLHAKLTRANLHQFVQVFQQDPLLESVVQILYLPNGHIELFRDVLICVSVYVPGDVYPTVALGVDVLLDDVPHLGIGILIFAHIVT